MAVSGQFRPFETLPFTVTFQTVPIPSLTSPCSPNFDQFLDHPKFHRLVSIQTTQRQFFQHFPIFGRFRAERTSRMVGNLVVSVSNAPFSLRNSFSAFIFSQKHFFQKKSGNWILDFFENFGIFSKIYQGIPIGNSQFAIPNWEFPSGNSQAPAARTVSAVYFTVP